MLKSIKYDLRRNRNNYLVIAGIFILAEIFFLFSNFAKDAESGSVAILVLSIISMALFIFVLLNGVIMYSKELSQKSGYLTFMTPVSPIKLIVSKLLTVFVVGTVILLVLVGTAFFDFYLLTITYPSLGNFAEIIKGFLSMLGYDSAEILKGALVTFVSLVINVFTIVSMAYLCVTISSTVFQNKSWKGIISFVLFVLLVWAVVQIGDLIPAINVTDSYSYGAALAGNIPLYLYFIVIIAADVSISGVLLDKKVSL